MDMLNQNIQSFNQQSDRYARSRPAYPEAFHTFIASLVKHPQRLWDCACGNGQVAIDAVKYFDEVYATDLSFNQVKSGFSHPKIRYACAEAEVTFFPDDFFDTVCVAQALHWFDIPAFFSEADRVLKSQGILAVLAYDFFSVEKEIDAVIESVLLKEIDSYWAEGNRTIISRYKGVKFPYEQVDSPSFTITSQWDLNMLLSYIGTWSSVKGYNKCTGSDIIGKLREHLSPLWKVDSIRTVTMDLQCYIRRK
jgi:ubiquinone/menaquinone biosynthesis C-methylase UbiE